MVPPKRDIRFCMVPRKLGIWFRMDQPKWYRWSRMVPTKVYYSIFPHYISTVVDFWCTVAIIQEKKKRTKKTIWKLNVLSRPSLQYVLLSFPWPSHPWILLSCLGQAFIPSYCLVLAPVPYCLVLAQPSYCLVLAHSFIYHIVLFVLGREEKYTVKYNPWPEGVPEGEAQGNSWRQRVIFDHIFRVES